MRCAFIPYCLDDNDLDMPTFTAVFVLAEATRNMTFFPDSGYPFGKGVKKRPAMRRAKDARERMSKTFSPDRI